MVGGSRGVTAPDPACNGYRRALTFFPTKGISGLINYLPWEILAGRAFSLMEGQWMDRMDLNIKAHGAQCHERGPEGELGAS